MASSSITSWQINGEKMKIVTDFIFLGFKITADGDWSHKIKRCWLLGRKAITNLDSILKSTDITLPTKVCLLKDMVLHLCLKYSFGISNFLEEISSLSHSIVFLYYLRWSLRKAFLSLLAILWNSAFKWEFLSFSPLLFAALLFTAICKASSDNHFAF